MTKMAEQDTAPDELQLKKRARRRLVGAAALALFAVIVLPMVMDREPRPLSQDIQVRIPGQDASGFASRLLPGKPAATPMPAPEPRPLAEQKAEAAAKPELAAAPAAPPVPAKPTAAIPAKPADRPAVQERKADADKPAAPEKKVPAAEKSPSATAIDARPAPDAAGQWVVQLGAYREAGKVKNLMSKLKGINVPAYTERTETPQGALTRVRAGPFASQEAAEKARGRVKIIGVDGPVAPK